MPVKFKVMNTSELEKNLANVGLITQTEIQVALAEIGKVGVSETRKIINAKTTPWGNRRVAANKRKYAGRRETDLMYKSVEYKVTPRRVMWGWIKNYWGYFSAQELGTVNGIQPMYAIRDSRQNVKDKLPMILQRTKQRILGQASRIIK